MSDADLKREIKRLSNLKQNKKRSISEIEKQAFINLQRRTVDIKSRFESSADKEMGKRLFDDYLDHYEFGNFSLLNTLADLIFEEVLKWNLQKQINTLNKEGKYPPDKLVKSLHEVEERVLKLKSSLGIDKQEQDSDLTKLEKLEKRFDLYIPFHRNEFTTCCGECGNLLLLRRRCGNEGWESLVHPMFSGRFWYNRRGVELVKSGAWTKEQYAWVFHTSVDYVNWCIDHENDIINIEGVEKDKVEQFINNNPFLKDVTVPSKILNKEDKK